MKEELEITIPTEEEIIEIAELYSLYAGITDLGIITGGDYDEKAEYSKTGRACSFFTKDLDESSKVITHDAHGKNSVEFDNHNGVIRPVIHLKPFKSISELTDDKGRYLAHNLLEIKLGEYPQYAPNEELQKILEKEYEQNNLKTTGKEYTFNRPFEREEDTYVFSPTMYKEYIYEGKKYVRVRSGSKNTFYSLSTKEKHIRNEYIWIEVMPVNWLYDTFSNTLISKRGLLSGIRFNNKKYNGSFSDTELNEYLNTYMLNDIMKISKINKEKNEIEEPVEENKHNNEINGLIDKINKLLDLNIYEDKEGIQAKIDSLITEYNKNIEMSFNNNSTLVLTNMNEDYLYIKLKDDLEDIYNEVNIKTGKYNNQIIILESINNCIKILDQENIEPKSDLEQDLLIIKNNLLPVINNKDKLIELKNKFIKDQEEILDYIKNKKDNPPYNNQNEYIITIRKILEKILLSINKEIKEKYIIEEIHNSYQNLVEGQQINSRDEYIKYLFEEIEKNIDIIKTKGNADEQQELYELFSDENLYGDNVINYISKLSNLFISTYKIVFDIRTREEQIKRKEDYTIKRK